MDAIKRKEEGRGRCNRKEVGGKMRGSKRRKRGGEEEGGGGRWVDEGREEEEKEVEEGERRWRWM